MTQRTTKRQTTRGGFSLLELLISLAILLIMMAGLFKEIGYMQKRGAAEQSRVDMFQQARALMDQMGRDLNMAGYPGTRLYAAGVLSQPVSNDYRAAAGLVMVSSSEIRFEGDVEGDGQVYSVRYSYTPTFTGAQCPCVQRSEVIKTAGSPLTQASNYFVAVENVATNGLTFAAFDQNGNPVTLPVDINSNPAALASIRTIQVTLNVLGQTPDLQTNVRPSASLTSIFRVMNN